MNAGEKVYPHTDATDDETFDSIDSTDGEVWSRMLELTWRSRRQGRTI